MVVCWWFLEALVGVFWWFGGGLMVGLGGFGGGLVAVGVMIGG